MQENNENQYPGLGSKMYSDMKMVIHRMVIFGFIAAIIIPLFDYDVEVRIISPISMGVYLMYHLIFFGFTKPRF